MLMYRQLLQPKTVDEAYEMALKFKTAPFLAGGCWIGLGTWRWPSVIDMSQLGLDYIRDEERYYAIGAMATQGDVERFEPFKTYGRFCGGSLRVFRYFAGSIGVKGRCSTSQKLCYAFS